MNRFCQSLYKIALQLTRWLGLLFLLFLFVCNLIYTCYPEDMTSQKVLAAKNPIPLYLLWVFAGIFLVFFLGKYFSRAGFRKFLLAAVMVWIILIGLIQLIFSKTVPAADALSVYSCAESLASGDLSVIHPTDSYLSYYPQQIGLTAFFELLIRFFKLFPFHVQHYHLIKLVYIALTCAIVFFQYRLTHLLWQNDAADCLSLLFSALHLPLLMYSAFLYGEIPSYAAILAGSCCLAGLLKDSGNHFLLRLAGSLSGFTLAVFFRKNSLIMIIAVLIVVLLEAIHQKSGKLLLFCILCAALSLSVLPCTIRLYEQRSGSTLKSGVPASSYFLMGMQESERAAGWYNGTNFETYRACGMDTEKTNAVCYPAISARIAQFKSNPEYTGKFYKEKFLSQWADGTFACRQATLATFGGRSSFFDAVYIGSLNGFFIAYCNIFQLFLYLGALLFMLLSVFPILSGKRGKKSGEPLFGYLLLIFSFGGFLFHMIWEANARYIFLYALALLPYAAKGFSGLLTALISRRVSSKA